jgi:hypothetical protein
MKQYHHFAACDVSVGADTHIEWACAVCPDICQAQFPGLVEPTEDV